MEPVLQRLGDVTIQRLEKPKDPKVELPSNNSSNTAPRLELPKGREDNDNSDEFYPSDEESGEEYEEQAEDDYVPPLPPPQIPKPLPQPQPAQDLKRTFAPSSLNLGPEISFKKFKPEFVVEKPVEKPIEKSIPNLSQKKFEDENEPSFSDDEMSYYDSDIESEGELQDLGSDLGLSLGLGDALKPDETKTQAHLTSSSFPANSSAPPVFPHQTAAGSAFPTNDPLPGFSTNPNPPAFSRTQAPPSLKDEDDEGSNGDEASFFEKLVEQAEVPPPTPSAQGIKNESTDEDYEIDIKEKLKEMGEITFASVKKGDKPKNSDASAENEVVITKKSGEEVTVMSKGNLRRNIREVMDETKLDETTLAAQRQEAERLKRVQEQQRILREYQRQAQQERMQQRVMSLLQGNNFPKPGPSNQTRIGNTVLVKLPNGQTKPMTKVPRPPFDLLKTLNTDRDLTFGIFPEYRKEMPKPEIPHSRHPYPQGPPPPPMGHMGPMGPMGPLGPMGAPRGYPRGPPMPHRRGGGVHLPASLSFAPVSKRGPPLMHTKFHHSDSDSEGEEMKGLLSPPSKSPKGRRGKTSDSQTIEVSSDDDCIVVSESEADQGVDDDDQDDPSNSGMHTNDEFNQPDEQGRVLVNVGHSEDEPDVFVAPQIARIIKPHQIGGVRFLYDNIVETINRFDSSAGFGCILAHSMGLGKTLQIVTFSDVFLRYTPAKTILCIMPINTLQNWMAEYNMWMPVGEAAPSNPLSAHGEVRPRNFKLHVLNDSHKTLVARQKVIHSWRTLGGVLLIGYEQFRLLSMKKNPKTKKRAMAAPDAPDDGKNKHIFDEIYTALVNPGPDLVICDEGHRIKNSHASISAALKQLRTKRRVVLTGYPLQNNLTEYWCMVDFVRPNYLGSKTEFLNMFERPIMNGQCIDSTEADIKLMRYRAHVLHSLLVGFVQRRSHTVLHTVLPQKEEYVLLVRLTPFQRKLYDTFMNAVVRNQTVPNPLKAFAVCCKIWNHPDVLYNFLVKRARGDAVDLDLEEVASTVSGVSSVPSEAKPKRGPGKPRKTPAKGRNGKPAASVTPYNSNTDSLVNSMQPPSSNLNGLPPSTQSTTTQSQFNTATNNPTTSFSNAFSNTPKSGDTNYGPYTDEFNQPRTSFEGISQFFDDHMSQSSYDNHFDDNAQFSPFPSPSSNFSQPQNSTNTSFQQPNQSFSQSLGVKSSIFADAHSPASNSQQPSNQTSLFNLDSQNTVTVTNTNTPKSAPSIPNLPSGISLTPLGSKNQQSANPAPPPVQTPRTPSPELMDISTPTNANQSDHSTPSPQYDQNPRNSQFSQQNSQFGSQNQNSFNPIQRGDFGYDQNFGQQHYWEPEKKPEFNQQGTFNSPTNNFTTNVGNMHNPPLWLKKEETSPIMTPNHLISPQKSESSNESKPRINIISDIKLPPVFTPEKKINIISDIKIEPIKEEKDDDKFGVKRELEKIKNELKNELKIQDDPKMAVNESPLAKLASLAPLRDSKEDGGIPYDWAIELLKDYVPGRIENSAKFQILFCIIRESLALGDRLLVFSQSLITLDLIEQFLQMSEIPGESSKWARNTNYYRLDGSTGAQEREKLINEFNSNPKIYLFLVSTRAGSLGINLIGANRVVVLDASWNPCHDTQAVCRVYRYGQRKPCFVYRLVVDNCLEKKIYDRQVSKQGMSDRVVDECNPDAHLTIKDVSTLCFDDKKDEGDIKDWSCCKDNYIDVVLQKVLNKHGTTLTKEPFQHESLLVDRKEKQLSQQEKRLAKKGYEREKNAARQPAYLSGSGRGQRPVASVRPMQQGGERPSRWIPAEHWQRQGMTAQEMTLPLDVVIPTNQPEKGNIVLKAGQKVLVLKSPKGVYMQLESGKIVAIKTAIKVKGKADDNNGDPMKMAPKPPLLPPQMKNNPSLSVIPQKRPQKSAPPSPQMPLIPGMTKFNVKSVQKTVPNLVSKIQSVSKKVQNMPSKPKPYQVGTEIAKQLREGEPMPGSSSEDEHLPPPMEKPRPQLPPAPAPAPVDEGADELEKKISQLKKNISIQRVTSGGVKQPLKPSGGPPQPSAIPHAAQQQQKLLQKESLQLQSRLTPQKIGPQDKSKQKQSDSILERLGQSTSRLENTPFQETLDSITAGFKNPENLDHLDSDEEEDDEDRPPIEDDDLEEEEEPEGAISDSSLDQSKQTDLGDQADQNEASDQSDEVTYVSEQPSDSVGQQFSNQQKSDGEYNSSTGSYNYSYNYNAPPYQGHPPPQGYGYPPQHPPPYDGYSGYPHGQPPYNYGYQGYPPPQPHYAPPPPQPGYDYNNPQPVYPSYPYPQQYPPPPQGMYPPPPASTAPPSSYPDYTQFPSNQSQSSSSYYQNS